jgi:hypothetical protein
MNDPLVVGGQVYDPATQIGDTVIRGAHDQEELMYLHFLWMYFNDEEFRAELTNEGYEWMTAEQYEDFTEAREVDWSAARKGE